MLKHGLISIILLLESSMAKLVI
jgi:hypothetical protein